MSNIFLLTGNVFDYAIPNVLFSDYLFLMIKDISTNKFAGFDVIIAYDKYNGGSILKTSSEGEEVNNISMCWDGLVDSMKSMEKSSALIINYPKYLLFDIKFFA